VTNFIHDVYVQDDYAYLAYWDAGCRILDASNPTNPVEVSWFGQTENTDMGMDGDPWSRGFGSPGNAHYVQPSPDGDYVFIGSETYVGESGGITVFEVTDFDNPQLVAEIEAEDRNSGIFPDTSHNFHVTSDRPYTSWYDAGVRVYDITDPSNPEQTYKCDPEDRRFGRPSVPADSSLGAISVVVSSSSTRTAANGAHSASTVVPLPRTTPRTTTLGAPASGAFYKTIRVLIRWRCPPTPCGDQRTSARRR
jgi:hypothetical protein